MTCLFVFSFVHCEEDDSINTPDINYCLVLRKWQPPDPSTEFRCFVYKNKLIGEFNQAKCSTQLSILTAQHFILLWSSQSKRIKLEKQLGLAQSQVS